MESTNRLMRSTWKKLKTGLPGGDIGRIGLAISPQNQTWYMLLLRLKKKQKVSTGLMIMVRRGKK